MINAKNLTKRYGHTVAIKNVSFNISKGEVVGFLGPNGAGKTTTMKILTCFLPADEGTATIADFDIEQNPFEVRRHIGYLPENAPLYIDMDVECYLRFIAQMRGMSINQYKQQLDKMIETCGLRKVMKKGIGTLSKGFRQRVGLAQTLIHDPQILILDEPTTGLDPNQIIEIRSLIKEIGKEKTVILCSHILPEVSATCDRILIINEGQIVADDTPQDLSSQAQGEETIYLGLKGADKDEISKQLQALDGIKCFNNLDDKNGSFRYQIKTHQGENLSEALFHMAVNNKWILTELHLESLSLEEIFLKLTSGTTSGTGGEKGNV